MRSGFDLAEGADRSTAVEMWYVTASVSGSGNARQFISQVPRVRGETLYPDASVTPRPICKSIRVAKVIGRVPSTGEMAAYVYVYFDSYLRYGNTPRSLSSDYVQQYDEDVWCYKSYELAPGSPDLYYFDVFKDKQKRTKMYRRVVRYGTGDVTDAMVDLATGYGNRIFVFASIPWVLVGHSFDSVNSGYWSVTYRFECESQMAPRPRKILFPGVELLPLPGLNYLEKYLKGTKYPIVQSATERFGSPVSLAELPGF